MNDSNKKKKPRRYRHLSDEERYDIIGYMDQGMSFRAIGRRIGRSASTVEREARRGLVRKKGWQKTPCPYLGRKGVSVCNRKRKLGVFGPPFLMVSSLQKEDEKDDISAHREAEGDSRLRRFAQL